LTASSMKRRTIAFRSTATSLRRADHAADPAVVRKHYGTHFALKLAALMLAAIVVAARHRRHLLP
jgi:hypothetical protein